MDFDAEQREVVIRPDRRPAIAPKSFGKMVCLVAAWGKGLYMSPALCIGIRRYICALRLAVQDIALSRRKHGFDPRWARQTNRWLVNELAAKLTAYGNYTNKDAYKQSRTQASSLYLQALMRFSVP